MVLKHVSLDPEKPQFDLEFEYNLEKDTAQIVACEMVKEYNFQTQYAQIIAEKIQQAINKAE